MFLTGPGGGGKSCVKSCCHKFCKTFCKAIGRTNNNDVFAVTGVSSVAASMAQEKTIHLTAMQVDCVLYSETYFNILWPDTKLLVIEGISMADKSLFIKLDKMLRNQTNRIDLLHGGINIVFVGDFLRLPPAVGKPLYDHFGWKYFLASFFKCFNCVRSRQTSVKSRP